MPAASQPRQGHHGKRNQPAANGSASPSNGTQLSSKVAGPKRANQRAVRGGNGLAGARRPSHKLVALPAVLATLATSSAGHSSRRQAGGEGDRIDDQYHFAVAEHGHPGRAPRGEFHVVGRQHHRTATFGV